MTRRPLLPILAGAMLVAASPALAAPDPGFRPRPWPDAAATLGPRAVVGPVDFLAGGRPVGRLLARAGHAPAAFEARGYFPGSAEDVQGAIADSTTMHRLATIVTLRPAAAKGEAVALAEREAPVTGTGWTRTRATLDGATLAGALAAIAPGRYVLAVTFELRFDQHVDGPTWVGGRRVLAHGEVPLEIAAAPAGR
jgi:hypothetical protein